MNIIFADEALRKDCNNQEMLIKRLGPARAKRLRQRLDELFNAEVLADLRSLPQVVISGPSVGGSDLALDLGHPCKLMFRPAAIHPGDGGWDWNKIDSIVIVALRGTDAERDP